MEEKRAKEVKMTPNHSSNKEQKLTYEQLNDACNQLFQQNQYLMKQVRELDMTNSFRRLDYLFKVIEFSSVFKDADFINSCLEEIKDAMTPSDEKSDACSDKNQ